ncbi:hypothetical protein VCRA2113O119_630003 [Vibrio crassostreae]|uniref:Uncharacterized protein n=2 Tax=Vibrio TaxID=662 RepID=A0AA87C3I1_9VIBR|nr:hypothetical protein VCRA2113O119_630003 [Vibrio crassostreae]CAK3117281.1 hypothetical protein VCRA215O110_650011 [Vibrio crassostreae]CAK3650977.1 hypothetical protein VCRA2120E126_640003 [Vibrio crassostreae]CDT70631.1 hypothetical protein VCR5J5_860003 [Vibrio crassostreae]CDT97778.1 hypothetical protein VCR31J2_2330010 [Vibrio coralliirubri]
MPTANNNIGTDVPSSITDFFLKDFKFILNPKNIMLVVALFRFYKESQH